MSDLYDQSAKLFGDLYENTNDGKWLFWYFQNSTVYSNAVQSNTFWYSTYITKPKKAACAVL